jgi:hypothetical protein
MIFLLFLFCSKIFSIPLSASGLNEIRQSFVNKKRGEFRMSLRLSAQSHFSGAYTRMVSYQGLTAGFSFAE